jgi:FixJ family two-component response regulator
MVVDVMMEHATAGLALARTVGELFKEIPVVILSGDTQKPNWMMQPNQTWDSVRFYLDKPVNGDKLLKVIEEVLGHGSQRS